MESGSVFDSTKCADLILRTHAAWRNTVRSNVLKAADSAKLYCDFEVQNGSGWKVFVQTIVDFCKENGLRLSRMSVEGWKEFSQSDLEAAERFHQLAVRLTDSSIQFRVRWIES